MPDDFSTDADADEWTPLARFGSVFEAEAARNLLEANDVPAFVESDATAMWLWHLGANIVGPRVMVRRGDMGRAADILAVARDEATVAAATAGPPEADDREDVRPPRELVRAFRASVIGILLLPPLLNIYSMYLLYRGDFFRSTGDWRAPAALLTNAIVFTMVLFFVALWVAAGPFWAGYPADGQPFKAIEEEPIRIPLIPPVGD
jgi:hypothetical protein